MTHGCSSIANPRSFGLLHKSSLRAKRRGPTVAAFSLPGGPDSDGLDLAAEQAAGTDPCDDDSDDDGYGDGKEVALGTDPLNPDDVPFVPALPAPAMALLAAMLLAASWNGLRRRARGFLPSIS
jgi:hypothetical protein